MKHLTAFVLLTARHAVELLRDLRDYPLELWPNVYGMHVAVWKFEVYVIAHTP